MTKNLILISIFFVAVVSAQQGSLYSDVKILSSDHNGITVEFRPQYTANKKVISNDVVFEIPQFTSGIVPLIEEAGREDIRTRILSLAVPSYSNNTVSIVAADYETINSFNLVPIPHIKMLDKMGAIEKKYQPKYLSSQKFYPEQIAVLKNIGMVKGLLTGNLVIAPYQFQSSSKTLKRYSRIVVRIDFGGERVQQDNSGNNDWATSSLLNYPVAKQWASAAKMQKSSAANSVLASGTWIKLEVTEDGMYKIDANYLRAVGIDPATLSSITDVKIFGADGRRIPENVAAIRPADLPQLSVEYVDNNSNAKFDNDDYVLFYGQGITGWDYNPITKQFSHYQNPYTFSNYYFLSVGANAPVKQHVNINVSHSTNNTISQTIGKVFFDEEKFNFNQSGQIWVSPPMNPNESRVVSNKLTGWVSGTKVTYSYKVFSRANVVGAFTLEESATSLGSVSITAIPDYYLNDPEYQYANAVSNKVEITPTLSDQRSNVKFTYSASGNVATGFIDWLNIFYTQQLTASSDLLVFDSPDTSGVVKFFVNGFSTNSINLYEVSSLNGLRKIAYSMDQQTGSFFFNDTLQNGKPKKYWIGTTAKYLAPKSAVKIPNSNLHGFDGAEFIIITHNEFKSEAQRLKNHKESLPGTKKLSTVVVDVDTIYNEFGIGMPDPSSMRDFIKHAATQWNIKAKYVLFFGDASYDFRSILKNDRSWVPSFQTVESNDKIYTLSNEDFFSYIDPTNPLNVSIAHGRLTPRTIGDAKLLVDRIIMYETKPPRDQWKNLITIVADDKWVPTGSEDIHTFQAEDIASVRTPKSFEVKRIYMEAYPAVFTSSGRRKPDARQAILDQVNRGTLMINYIGHGNPKVWAHESVLTLDDVRSQFVNGDRLTFIVAATCDWGRFEEAGENSSAEEVMVNKNGGAIGVLSASRVVYSGENSQTNQLWYINLFSQPNSLRLGDAYLLTKNQLGDGLFSLTNKQKYFLLGDPTLRLAVPERNTTIDSILTSISTIADTVRALEKITIKATVRDSANLVDVTFNGNALISVFDADMYKNIPAILGLNYYENGGIIYKGESSVNNGLLSTTFIVPKDIAYEKKNGRISIYFYNSSSDGRGYTRNFIVGGSSPSIQPDSVGPNLAIYFDNFNFRSGDVVNENPKLIVALKDSSGINSSVNSIGHRLEAWIDGGTKSIDLTDSYKGKIDSYQEGAAEYQLNNLTSGSHSIKVRAWDVHNNSSTTETYFTVATSNSLSIQQLYNFPNPVSTTTAFTFQHNQMIPIDVKIQIYTVAGRLIHTIEKSAISERFIKIDWNRRDMDGDEVGNGIYFYKVLAKTIDGRYSSEAIGKMAVAR